MSLPTAMRGVHMCGSFRLPSKVQDDHNEVETTEQVLRAISSALPRRLRRMPDGEVGKRQEFALWQAPVFARTPWICTDRALQSAKAAMEDTSPDNSQDIVLAEPEYDTNAIQNYKIFAKLKQEGLIDPQTRFQVCIPTPLNPVTLLVKHEHRAEVEPIYEALIIKAVRNIQDQIPHHDLAIQWDCPMEISTLEGVHGPDRLFVPHFPPTMSALTDRIQRVAAVIESNVQLGFHLCYGDSNHKHFVQPRNTLILVNLANAISSSVERRVDWFHMPVPIDRMDDEYFAALEILNLDVTTEIYLGLVHAHDLEGTRKRIAAASKVLPVFGLATECGMGRTPTSDIASILDISNELSEPVL